MKNTYKTFVKTGVLCGWLRIHTFDHGHTGAVFEVRKAFSLLKGVLKVFRGEESARRIRAFYAEAKFMLSDALEGYKPKCLDGVATKDEMWFVMQRVGHMPKKLPPKLLVKHLSRIATALAMMHAMKLIHGDVKRENLGIYKGLAILLDYGCMQTFKQAEEDPTFNGTWDYMPDEVRKKKSIDYRADIYALGMTLKALCPDHYLGIFQPVIERATAEKPEDRYQSMDEFRIALENCEKEFMHVMALASRLPKFKRVAAICGGVAIAVVLGWWNFNKFLYVSRDKYIATNSQALVDASANARVGIMHYESNRCDLAVMRLTRAIESPEFNNIICDRAKVYRILSECYRGTNGVPRNAELSRRFAEKETEYRLRERCGRTP